MAMVTIVAPVAALLFAVAIMLVGHGLQSTVLPLRAEAAQFGDFAIGLISSAYFAGFVVGCLLVPYAIMRAGHIRAFAAIVSLASAAALIHPLFVEPWMWTAARALSGFCVSGFYMIVESWLNEKTANRDRGLVMSIYVIVNYAALSGGQMLTTQFDASIFAPFIVASMFVSLAVIPVALTKSQQPAPITIVRFRPRHLYERSPTAIVACVLIGLSVGSAWSLSTVYATRVGLTADQAAMFMAAFVIGGGLGQWPFGRISDFVDRRIVLGVTCVGTIAVCIALIVLTPLPPMLTILAGAVLGAFCQPAYAIAVAHAFDHAEPEGHVETSSGLLLAFGLGSIAGPLLASFLMRHGGPAHLFTLVAIAEVLLLLFIIQRMTVRSSMSAEDKGEWDLGSTAPIGTVITPEPLDIDDPDVVIPELIVFETPDDALNRGDDGALEIDGARKP